LARYIRLRKWEAARFGEAQFASAYVRLGGSLVTITSRPSTFA
jgi:hypothetical protein